MTDSTLKVLEAVTGGTDLGAISAMQGATPVKIGKQHLVDVAGAATGVTGNPVIVGGTVAVTGTQTDALTNTQLRASAVPVSGTVTASVSNFPATQAVSGSVNIGNSPTVSVSNFPANQTNALTNAELRASAVPVSGPATNAELRASALPVSLSGVGADQSTPAFMARIPNNLGVTAVGAAAAAVTATIPAVGGQFHYIDVIEITCYASAAGTGGATPVTVTSTNLPGNHAWTFPSGRAIGTIVTYSLSANSPVKSSSAGVATTIVCPATTGVIWRVNIMYRTAA